MVCGGRSSEHAVSLRSTREMLEALTATGPHPSLVFSRLLINPQGGFHYDPRPVDGKSVLADPSTLLEAPASQERALQALGECDLVFSLLHGTHGEDGAFQGFLETLGVPYVGSDVLSSALCMNKVRFREWAKGAIPNIPICDWDLLHKEDWTGELSPSVLRIANRLGWPLFVKPACGGSSRGISRVHGEDELVTAIEEALAHDSTVLFEANIPELREVEVAILGDGSEQSVISPVGEILLPEGGWYDYETKYENNKAGLAIPAQLEPNLAQQLRDFAQCAYRAAGCQDLARVDFLLGHGKDIYLNEINTLPGFTSISMYTKLMGAAGIPYTQVVERLVALALSRKAPLAKSAAVVA